MSNNNPEIEKESKCKLGLKCDTHGSGCKFHYWTYRHDEAWIVIQVMLIFSIVMIGAIMIFEHNYVTNTIPIQEIIKGYNCGQLAEYVADKSPQYSFAEHRYSWLCVHEQIKEFQ